MENTIRGSVRGFGERRRARVAARGSTAPARNHEGEGKEAGKGRYHAAKLRRRLVVEEGQRNGGRAVAPRARAAAD
jgi:hypothetical protein